MTPQEATDKQTEDAIKSTANTILIPGFSALGVVILAAALFLGVICPGINKSADKKLGRNNGLTPSKQPIPEDVEAAGQRLRNALKDPAMTDRLIEQLKDPSVIEKVTADPEIMTNLRKLANAIEVDVKSEPEQASWANKAIQRTEKGASSITPNK